MQIRQHIQNTRLQRQSSDNGNVTSALCDACCVRALSAASLRKAWHETQPPWGGAGRGWDVGGNGHRGKSMTHLVNLLHGLNCLVHKLPVILFRPVAPPLHLEGGILSTNINMSR